VHPNATKQVHAIFTPPSGVDNTTLPVYSGFIHVTSPAETLKVTYLGVAASLKATSVLDSTDEFFGIGLPAVINANGRPQEGPTNYTFMGQDFPFLLLRQVVFFIVAIAVANVGSQAGVRNGAHPHRPGGCKHPVHTHYPEEKPIHVVVVPEHGWHVWEGQDYWVTRWP
jgi:hypothetical protein